MTTNVWFDQADIIHFISEVKKNYRAKFHQPHQISTLRLLGDFEVLFKVQGTKFETDI